MNNTVDNTMYHVQQRHINTLEQVTKLCSEELTDVHILLSKAREVLKFYGDLKYSHTMGFPPEVQWLAEDMIKQIDLFYNDEKDTKNEST